MSNFNARPTGAKKADTSMWVKIKNTGRGAQLFMRNLIAGAEAAAWLIAEGALAVIVYNALKGNLPINDLALGAVTFAAVVVGMRMGYEFVLYLNKQGQKYEQ